MNGIEPIHLESVAFLMLTVVWILCHKHHIGRRSWLAAVWAAGLATSLEIGIPFLNLKLVLGSFSTAFFLIGAFFFLAPRWRWIAFLFIFVATYFLAKWFHGAPMNCVRFGALLWFVSVWWQSKKILAGDVFWLAWIVASCLAHDSFWPFPWELAPGIFLFISLGLYARKLPFFQDGRRLPSREAWTLAGILAATIFSCTVTTEMVGRWSDLAIRANLLSRAELLKQSLPPDAVKEIATLDEWWKLPSYRVVLDQITRVASHSPDIRFIYVMKQDGQGKILFLADAQVPEASSPGDLYDDASEEMRAVFSQGKSVVEGPVADEWGNWISALVPLRDHDGSVLGLLGMDLSSRQWVENVNRNRMAALLTSGLLSFVVFGSYMAFLEVRDQALRLSSTERKSRLLESAVEQSNNGIIITDMTLPDAPIIYVNEAFEDITGYSAKEALGKNCRFLQGAERDENELEKLRAAIKGCLACRVTLRNYRKSGELFWNSLSLSPVLDTSGRLTHYIGILTDVTRQKKSEDELRLASEAAEKANKAKSAFLATVSHELRTPLHGIIGTLDLIPEGKVPEHLQGTYETIQSSAQHALQLINDILDFSKIESDSMQLERSRGDLWHLLDAAVDTVRSTAHAKKLPLHLHIHPGVPQLIFTDHLRLRQILVNLLGNAVKFTSAGEVRLEADKVGGTLFFSIHDSGIGIDESARGKMFLPFSQQDSGMARRFGGTGLGLAISRKLAVLLGGNLDYESRPGQGSTFFVSLPLTESADPMPVSPAVLSFKLEGGTPEQQKYFSDTLRALGTPVVSAADSQGELKAQWLGRDGIQHDLVLSSGLQDMEKGRCVEYPPRLEFWQRTIKGDETLIRQSTLPEGTGPDWHGGHSPAVLLAEDNPVNLKIALGMLKRLGIEPDSVRNGKEAVQAASAKQYDIVLTDIQMPEMDGVEAMKLIVADAKHRPLFVAMTANAMQSDRDSYLASGFDDVVAKPFRLEDLRQCLLRWKGPRFPLPEMLDEEQLADLNDGWSDDFISLLGEFVKEVRLGMAGMEATADGNDPKKIRELAHSLKGMSANLGFRSFSEKAAAVENKAKQGLLPSPRELDDLEKSWNQSLQDLQKLSGNRFKVPE